MCSCLSHRLFGISHGMDYLSNVWDLTSHMCQDTPQIATMCFLVVLSMPCTSSQWYLPAVPHTSQVVQEFNLRLSIFIPGLRYFSTPYISNQKKTFIPLNQAIRDGTRKNHDEKLNPQGIGVFPFEMSGIGKNASILHLSNTVNPRKLTRPLKKEAFWKGERKGSSSKH